ncbi:MAG: hypothetical protein NTZ44_00795 [Candidatus Nomurabacteria bacterium]|nr:hypothetical protein [Candidatus Nomurabacteria bacterium]
MNIFTLIYNIFQAFLNATFNSGPTSVYHIILTILSLFFIIIISYCSVRMLEIRKREHEHLHHEIHEYAEKHTNKESKNGTPKNERWESVLKYLASSNMSDWKLAIIEADAMLEDLTDLLEFQGDNLGERLKSVNKDRFKSLDDAWEAHIVRNKIAHEGLKFEITQREAQRVIYLYEKVFREFGHI